MLTITQRRVLCSAHVKTTITIEPLTIYCSRLIDSKLYKLKVNLDGSISDLGAKINRVAILDNSDFVEFARISNDL